MKSCSCLQPHHQPQRRLPPRRRSRTRSNSVRCRRASKNQLPGARTLGPALGPTRDRRRLAPVEPEWIDGEEVYTVYRPDLGARG